MGKVCGRVEKIGQLVLVMGSPFFFSNTTNLEASNLFIVNEQIFRFFCVDFVR